MRARTVATVVVAVVMGFGAFGILAADAANPAGYTAVVNPLAHVPAGGELFGTSCTSATQCVAVGWDLGHQPLALNGDPASWGLAQTQQVTLPGSFNKAPASGSWLLSVSCSSSTSCVAVGQDGNDQPLVLMGNPSTWTAAQAREITLGAAFGSGGSLDGLTCTSSTSCVAVGYDDSGDFGQPIVLTGNPSAWSAAQVRDLALGAAFGDGGSLESVTCTSPTACVAVGSDYTGNIGDPIVLAGDPATWVAAQVREVTLGASFGSGGLLWSLACTSATSCLAVGNDGNNQPLVLSGDPASWNVAQAYEVTLGSGFGTKGSVVSVTCPSVSSCVAVGWDGKHQPLVLAGDPSTTWTAAQAAEITLGAGFGSGAYLDSISCASSAACVVTGTDATGQPLTLSGDPSTWGAAQATKVTLNGVQWGASVFPSALTCLSATSCIDIGSYPTYGFLTPGGLYYMKGNRTTWNQASATQMTGLSPWSFIAGNACRSATFCVAVGGDGATGEPLVLVGNPSTWGTTHGRVIPLGTGFGSGGELSSVACSSATSCVAVGQTYKGQPLVLRGNPATWTNANAVQITLPTALHSRGALDSVTCISATNCFAVGYDGHYTEPLVFHGNPASWKAASAKQIVLTAALGTDGELVSIACTSSTSCVSVGDAGTTTSKPLVLVGNPATWAVTKAFNLKVAAATTSTVAGFGGFGGTGAVWSVSCNKAPYCVAVGGDGLNAPVYIAGNPTQWHLHKLVRPLKNGASFAAAELDTTSCIPTKCFAGGFANGGDFLGSFNGVASGGQVRGTTISAAQAVSSVRGWDRAIRGAERRETKQERPRG
jgi:hypothetical protein